MSILNVNQIQPVGSGQTITISASDITASSATITASSVTATTVTSSSTSTFSSGLNVTGGNIGIGTDNVTIGSASYKAVQVHSEGTNSYLVLTNNSSGTDAANDGVSFVLTGSDVNILNRESGNILLSTNGQERARVTSGGYVGIGLTNPQYKLDLYGNPGTDAGALLRLKSSINDDNGIIHEQANGQKWFTGQETSNPNDYEFWNYNGSTWNNILNLDGSGDVTVTDGNLVIGTSGHGISFAATSDAAGMTSELLDDYEEGSWTPAVARTSPTGSATHTRQSGRYTKIGNVVTIWFDITWTAAPGGSGDYVITSLPYTAQTGISAGDGGFGAVQFRDASGLSSNIRIYGNSSYHADTRIFCQHYDSSGNTGNSPFNASGRITGWSQYFV